MKKLALALCAATALFASNGYKFEISPVVGYAHPDGTHGVADYNFIGLRLGRNIDKFLVSQIEIGFDYSSGVKYRNCYMPDNKVCTGLEEQEGGYYHPGFKTKLSRFYLNLVKDINVLKVGNLVPYALIGVGYQDYTREVADNLEAKYSGFYGAQDAGFAQGGLGLKYFVKDNFALKAEARALRDFEGEWDYLYSLGFGVSFSGSKKVVESDEDGDGVPDGIDRCPGTPEGTVVDEYGCEKITRLTAGGGGDAVDFTFRTGAYTLSAAQKAALKPIADKILQDPTQSVIVEGHTDNVGRDANNQLLSERRAKSVRDELVKYGVPAEKSKSFGYGRYRPIAENTTPEGRNSNRRIDLKYTKRDLYAAPNVEGADLVRLNNNLGFTRGAVLNQAQINELQKIVDKVKGKRVYTVVVEGYTDNRGNKNTNLRLSNQRAAAVARKLIDLGLDADKVSYKGYGVANPIADNNNAKGRTENRRVDVKVKTSMF